MAEKCYQQRPALEISSDTSKACPASSPSKVFCRSRTSSKQFSCSGCHKRVLFPPLLIKSLYRSQVKRERKVNPGSVKTKCLSRSPQLLSSLPQNFEGDPASKLLDGQDRPYRCLPSCPRQQRVSEVPSLPLERQNLCVYLPPLRALSGSGCFPGPHKLPLEALQSQRNSVSSLSRRHNYLRQLRAEVPGGPPLRPRYSGPSRVHSQPRKVPACPYPVYGLVGSSLGQSEPFSSVTSGESSGYQFHGFQSAGKGEDVSQAVGKPFRPSGLCGSNLTRVEPPQKALGSYSSTHPRGCTFPSIAPSGHPFGPSLVDQSIKLSEAFPVQSIPSLSPIVDRCLPNGLGGPRPVRFLGRRLLGSEPRRFPHEHPGTSGSLFIPPEQSCSSRLFCQSLFRQFNNCSSSPEAGLLSIPVSYVSSEQHLLPVSKERFIDLSSQNPRESQRSCRCPVSKCPSPGRMGAPPSRSTGYPRSVPKFRSGPDGNPLQLCSGILRKPFQSPLGIRGGCLESGLESMEGGLPVSSSLSSDQGLPSPALVQRQDGPDFKSSSSSVPSHGSSEVTRSSLPAPPSPQTAGSGSLGRGWKALVLSLDGTSLLRSHLTEKYGFSMADRLVNGKRQSTLYQQNIAWKAFQEFLSSLEDSECPDLLGLENSPLSISHVLHFCLWLREYKNLQSTTIANYKSSVGGILQSVFNLDCSTWEFSALRNNFFLEKPTNPPRVPEWDIQKVLLMLDSGAYINSPPSKFLQLKKTLFLLAIATGNRVSELHAITRNGLGTPDPDQPVRLAVKPGFLYKNQKANRAPPNIEVVPLTEGPPSLCPVKNLALYLKLTSKVATGPLFLNSKTDAPIHKSTVSRLICAVIDEADPGKFPRVHDTRRVGTSIAWSRGLDPQEIIRRTFWRSSSIFIDRYLSVKGGINCVALNTC